MSLSDPAFRALFEDAPIGIVIADEQLKVVDVNAAYCDMLGMTEAEVMASSIPDFTHPEDRQRDREFMPLVLSGALPRYKADKRYLRKDGEVVWARIVVTALLDPSGRSRYAFSMAQSLADEHALRRLLPVCAGCRKVRDESGAWIRLEGYLSRHVQAQVLEARCPDCARSGTP